MSKAHSSSREFVVLNNGKLRLTAHLSEPHDAERIRNIKLFMQDFSDVFQKLDDLLDINHYFENNRRSVLEKRLRRVVEFWNKNDTPGCHAEICAMKLLVQDLEKLKRKSPQMFNKFKKELRRQRSSDGWQGYRFELHIAVSLLDKFSDVVKRERPDFQIQYGQNRVFVEAGSARVNSNKGKNHYYKVHSALNSKNRKTYANKSTALCIDMTNIMHEEMKIEIEDEFPRLIGEISSNKSLKFGAIVLYCFSMDYEVMQYRSLYRCVPLDNCDSTLSGILSEAWPRTHDDGFIVNAPAAC